MMLFEYPANAALRSILHKKKFYEKTNPTAAIKGLFTRQVEQMIWQFKLASETINVKETPDVMEIQVFRIILKNGEISPEVLRSIDRAIAHPIIFELRFDNKVKPIAAFKRPSEADRAKWVISDYFSGTWMPDNTPRAPLPLVLDLEALYEQLLAPLLPYPARAGERMQARVERMECIRQKQREIERCEERLRKEKQFNYKIGINAELRDLKQELEGLIQ